MSDDLERYMEERRAEAHEDERQADDLAATISQLQAEIAQLREALEMAVGMLAPLEPGDSRAVSNEFVALASIVAGCDNVECWQIVSEWNERERARAALGGSNGKG